MLCTATTLGCGALLAFYWILNRHATVPDTFDDHRSEPILASFSRSGNKSSVPTNGIRHFTLYWNCRNSLADLTNMTALSSSRQPILLTVKMWVTAESKKFRYGTLEATFRCKHDAKIKELCNILSRCRVPVFLRWNPEMETPAGLYPWQGRSTDAYIKAFRHFGGLAKECLPSLQIVWGPVGFPRDLEYWPGPDVVDVISMTLDSPSETRSDYKYPQGATTAQVLKSKLHRLRFLDKPFLLLGSERMNEEAFDPACLDTAIQALREHDAKVTESRSKLLVIAGSAQPRTTLTRQRQSGTRPILGVYDPERQLVDDKEITIEHLFADDVMITNGCLQQAISESASRQHDILLTYEPGMNKRDDDVLNNTIKGLYDSRIRELAAMLTASQRRVYLRWAHEMEIPVKRYPWQSQDPLDYIEAFRHVASEIKAQTTNVMMIWGPAGDPASLDFWPGEDVVDIAGLAVYGLPSGDISDYTKQDSFEAILVRKMRRLNWVNKPVFVVEMGVTGPEGYQKNWLKKATKTLDRSSNIIAVCYFNMPDLPKAWGDIAPPVWSISKDAFSVFTAAFSRGRDSAGSKN